MIVSTLYDLTNVPVDNTHIINLTIMNFFFDCKLFMMGYFLFLFNLSFKVIPTDIGNDKTIVVVLTGHFIKQPANTSLAIPISSNIFQYLPLNFFILII